MIRGKASWTAEITAVFRASESIRPSKQRILNDMYAVNFLRPGFRLILRSRMLTKFILWLAIDRRFPGASDMVVSRVRFIDDCLHNCINDGLEQLVILGAGYDSRPYRFIQLKDKPIFEVDHPNTQALKKRKIETIFGHLPAHVTFVPIDFEKDRLMPKLTEKGYNPNLKTLFIWEGVCKYLSENAVNELLLTVSGNSRKGSSIVFEYLFKSMIDGSSHSKIAGKVLKFQARKGEPFIFGLPETNPGAEILSKGFSKVENVNATELQSMFFSGMARGNKINPFWGIIHAIV